VHFSELRISREWWYFNAVFNDSLSQLKDWSIAVSFNHMARGDLLGTNKPDLLVVSVLGNKSETYGGMENKEHYLGILKEGTLIAGSPGVKIQFENSWAEGSYPHWHVHAEDSDIDTAHEIVVDLEYTARSLPIWVLGPRAFNKSESEVANYVLLGCDVSGTVTIDGQIYTVKGTGSHEHSWTPNAITRLAIGGWDWFSFNLDNGWNIYAANYLPSPQAISGALSKLDPFGTLLITTDRGETITELKDVNLKITQKDEKVFPLVKLPAAFSINADPSVNPLYVISQSLLYGTKTTLNGDIEITHATSKLWKFPTYMGMKIGYCTIDGTISWSDNDGDHEVPIHGIGVSWNMRALL
jgi:predicted secreted hydrolase